jgi:hypothetical protein
MVSGVRRRRLQQVRPGQRLSGCPLLRAPPASGAEQHATGVQHRRRRIWPRVCRKSRRLLHVPQSGERRRAVDGGAWLRAAVVGGSTVRVHLPALACVLSPLFGLKRHGCNRYAPPAASQGVLVMGRSGDAAMLRFQPRITTTFLHQICIT